MELVLIFFALWLTYKVITNTRSVKSKILALLITYYLTIVIIADRHHLIPPIFMHIAQIIVIVMTVIGSIVSRRRYKAGLMSEMEKRLYKRSRDQFQIALGCLVIVGLIMIYMYYM